MALHIEDPEADRLARELAEQTGAPVEEAVIKALRAQLEKEREIAREAFRRYGKGQGHPARLNFGDCFAYALAKATGEPLLFKGGDFAETDISVADY